MSPSQLVPAPHGLQAPCAAVMGRAHPLLWPLSPTWRIQCFLVRFRCTNGQLSIATGEPAPISFWVPVALTRKALEATRKQSSRKAHSQAPITWIQHIPMLLQHAKASPWVRSSLLKVAKSCVGSSPQWRAVEPSATDVWSLSPA